MLPIKTDYLIDTFNKSLFVSSTSTPIEMTVNNTLDINMVPKLVDANVGTLLGTNNKSIGPNQTDDIIIR